MSACAVLVAALAVQPALGRDGGKGKGRDGEAAPVAGAAVAPAPAAPAPAAAAPKAARKATTTRRTSGKSTASSSSGRRKAGSARQVAADPAAPAAPVVDQAPAPPPPPPVDPPPVDPPATPVPVGTTPGPEDGATGAPTPAAPTPAPETPPVAVTPTPAAPETPRTPAAPADARPATPTPDTAVGAADREAITADAPLVTSSPTPAAATAADAAGVQSLTPTSATDPAATGTNSSSPSARPSATASGTAPAAGAGSAQPAAGINRLLPATDPATGGTTAPTALGVPLRNQATTAITRVQVAQSGTGTTSRPASGTNPSVPTLDTQPSTVTKILRHIPTAMWFALGGLGALVLLLGAYSLLAAARTRRLQRHREKLMEDIGLLQAALLPAVPSRMGALLTTVAYRPADGPAAGGDFYDAFPLPDGKVAILLGDVSGHGRQALAKTTLVRFTVRAHLEAGMSPREAIAIAGRSLDGRLADDFSTVLAAIHDPATGTLTYSSAGHPPPLVLGPSAHAPVTASSAPPIGAGFPTGQRQTIVPMPEGTTVAVYSDGLLEARIAGEPVGSERLAGWLTELGPEATAKQLLDLVVQRADRVPDDLAAVVLHAAPGATAPAARVEQLKLDVLDVEGPDLDGFLKAAGVSRTDRAMAGRAVSEQLAITGGVIVEVRTGEHPTVSVYAIGDRPAAARQSASAR
jgi:hypothetical protein